MELTVHNQSGAKESMVGVNARLFGAPMRTDLVYQVATSQMANRRQVLAHTKTRAGVSGGGIKPWRQKGTGRARHGSIRSPIWVGGGIAHGPSKFVNFSKTIPKAMARSALASVLSARVAEGRLFVVDALDVPNGKTKEAVRILTTVAKALPGYRAGNRVLLVLPGTAADLPIRRATGNLQFVQTIRAQDLNVLTVLAFPFIIATQEALTKA